ncbi:MAG: undecaprenyldiphospho-muramoylpentapeptide beta-N-acetylglucosaminyltransferase [Lautropia sp.]|nr:undecaprenyldiphospho-muramoylpentapeptide beta-N-acetylglucosaminyltransferase [Lautropia sp.]
MRARRILIMAGGTGGHIFPGLAVAELLRERGWEVFWLGNPEGMEGLLVPPHDIEMKSVHFQGLRGKGVGAMLRLPLRLRSAYKEAAQAFDEVRPDVVLGMGGYVTVPGGLVARARRIPLVLHEQNSVAGMANRFLARMAERVLVAFPGAMSQARWAGNPVGRAIAAIPAPEQRYRERSGPLRVLVVGGSLGAQAFNRVIPNAFGLMLPENRPEVLHQSGRAHLKELRNNYQVAAVEAKTVAFIENMAEAYSEADLVIARAGATTVSELAAAGVASILVPYPYAVDDHQTGNARFLSETGAAILIPQPELAPSSLASLLSQFTRPALASMAAKARALGKPDAAQVVADACEAVVKS